MITPIYIPIIKGKFFDLKAIGELPSHYRNVIKPLIELPPTPDSSNVDKHLNKFITYLTRHGGEGNIFVDFNGFIPDELTAEGIPAPIAGYNLLKKVGIYVTPVYGFDRDELLWKKFEDIIKEHNRGFCFRLVEDDIEEDIAVETWENILTRTSQLQINFTDVDLVIDLKDVRTSLVIDKISLVTDFLKYQPKNIEFRSLVISGSSAPKDVSVIKRDSIGKIERKELKIWAFLKTDLVNRASLIYSDYGIVHPEFSAYDLHVGGTANRKIRYTFGNNIVIFRGHMGDPPQSHALALQVFSHPSYCGEDYSSGDKYIDDVAHYRKGSGNLGNWVQSDMNHHIVHTCIQINHLNKALVGDLSENDVNEVMEEFEY